MVLRRRRPQPHQHQQDLHHQRDVDPELPSVLVQKQCQDFIFAIKEKERIPQERILRCSSFFLTHHFIHFMTSCLLGLWLGHFLKAKTLEDALALQSKVTIAKMQGHFSEWIVWIVLPMIGFCYCLFFGGIVTQIFQSSELECDIPTLQNKNLILALLAIQQSLVEGKRSITSSILKYSSSEVQNDRTVIMAAVQTYGCSLKFASQCLRNDNYIVLLAVCNMPEAIQHASERLKNDKVIAMAALHRDGMCLRFCGPDIRGNKTCLLAAVYNMPEAIRYASERLKNDGEIAMAALHRDAKCLRFCGPDIRGNKTYILAAASQTPETLRYALNGLNHYRDCLIAAGIWDKGYGHDNQPNYSNLQQAADKTSRTKVHDNYQAADPITREDMQYVKSRIVLSTRFSLSQQSNSATATSFAVALKNHYYIRGQMFTVYSPNAFNKQSCDPEWTRFSWPCRGTFETCRMADISLKRGPPTNASCWRYSFRYQLEQAKQANGFMIQVIELQENWPGDVEFRVGRGQKIESAMAKEVGIKVFRIYQPACDAGEEGLGKENFTTEHIDKLVESVQDWYRGGCSDMTEVEIKCGTATALVYLATVEFMESNYCYVLFICPLFAYFLVWS